MINTILSLGTNLGDRKKNIEKMVGMLKKILQPPIKYSKLMETEPVGIPDKQEWFYNLIMLGRYDGSAKILLETCKEIEKLFGRERKSTLEARTSDIDILLIDDCIIDNDDLIVPHPHILSRRFCIEGIISVAPDWVHPLINKSFAKIGSSMEGDVLNQQIHFI